MDLMTLAMAKKMGGGGSWNDLTDKPFGEEVTEGVIEFNGDLTGREYLDLGGIYFVKMSDKILNAEDMIGATVSYIEQGVAYEHIVTEDMVATINEDGMIMHTVALNAESDALVASATGAESFMGLSDGTHFYFLPPDMCVKSISCLTGEVETIKPLDAKYLPPLVSPNGTKYAITVSDDGTLSAKVTK